MERIGGQPQPGLDPGPEVGVPAAEAAAEAGAGGREVALTEDERLGLRARRLDEPRDLPRGVLPVRIDRDRMAATRRQRAHEPGPQRGPLPAVARMPRDLDPLEAREDLRRPVP
jgi:hypothetical protein